MMTSNGTSRLMTTWTGAILNRLSVCALVLGKPSSNQLRLPDDKRFSSPPIIFNMSSSGTSCPLETNLNNSRYKYLRTRPSNHLLVDFNAEVGFFSYHVSQYVAARNVQHVKRSDYAFGHRTFSRARSSHNQGAQSFNNNHCDF